MKFLDTNIFVRFLTNDDQRKALACRRLFRRLAAGTEEAATSEVVIAEVAHVVTSGATYGFSHRQAAAVLRVALSARGIRIPSRSRVFRALDLFGENQFLDFVDALIVAESEERGWTSILSYDRDFDRVSGVTREEP